jgi:predicted acetyltransferase
MNANIDNFVLVLPSIEYMDSFLEAIKEIQKEEKTIFVNNEQSLDLKLIADPSYFKKYIKQLRNESKGLSLPKAYVPHTTFWMIEQKDGKDTFVGRVDIRHKLNERLLLDGGHIGYVLRPKYRGHGLGTLILKLALKKAKTLVEDAYLYDEQVLLTCNINNLASQRVIENNSGVLLKITDPGRFEPYQMFYWINLAKA